MSTKQEYIAEADRLLVQAGVPTYSEVLDALQEAGSALRDEGMEDEADAALNLVDKAGAA